jgi:hypothetical protein
MRQKFDVSPGLSTPSNADARGALSENQQWSPETQMWTFARFIKADSQVVNAPVSTTI